MDTRSHHGTYVHRNASIMRVLHEVPLALESGDKIVLGKEVVKGSQVSFFHLILLHLRLLLHPRFFAFPSSSSSSSDPEPTCFLRLSFRLDIVVVVLVPLLLLSRYSFSLSSALFRSFLRSRPSTSFFILPSCRPRSRFQFRYTCRHTHRSS